MLNFKSFLVRRIFPMIKSLFSMLLLINSLGGWSSEVAITESHNITFQNQIPYTAQIRLITNKIRKNVSISFSDSLEQKVESEGTFPFTITIEMFPSTLRLYRDKEEDIAKILIQAKTEKSEEYYSIGAFIFSCNKVLDSSYMVLQTDTEAPILIKKIIKKGGGSYTYFGLSLP